ncbi:MAG: prepilin-type N-terminal cleavage/methylation domain-containing protein, partial [Phycisphaerales bacterium]
MTYINTRRGFSLIELLLAIFILGIGIISIATLFPAGIAQQLKTTDDVIGPIVARNALTLIRSRVEQEDFGGAEPFEPEWSPFLCGLSLTQNSINPWPTICGDWMWRRPALVQDDYGDDGDYYAQSVRGAIDIFATPDTNILGGDGAPLTEYWTDTRGLPGIPYNKERYPDLPVYGDGPNDPPTGFEFDVPTKRILASERQYPMWSGAPLDRPKAEYYWDCMFKRFEGRMQVAVFVYRVIDPTNDGPYTIDTKGVTVPNLPVRVNLSSDTSTGSWNALLGSEELIGSELDDPSVVNGQWQYPGQWLVDQNGNIHTVQRGRRRMSNASPVLLNAPPV